MCGTPYLPLTMLPQTHTTAVHTDSHNSAVMDLDLAKERGLLLGQGPAGPAIVEGENED